MLSAEPDCLFVGCFAPQQQSVSRRSNLPRQERIRWQSKTCSDAQTTAHWEGSCGQQRYCYTATPTSPAGAQQDVVFCVTVRSVCVNQGETRGWKQEMQWQVVSDTAGEKSGLVHGITIAGCCAFFPRWLVSTHCWTLPVNKDLGYQPLFLIMDTPYCNRYALVCPFHLGTEILCFFFMWRLKTVFTNILWKWGGGSSIIFLIHGSV